MASNPNPLEGFRRLSPTISVYEPPSSSPSFDSPNSSPSTPPSTPSTNASTTPPSLIILCTWMGGATPRRISKYTQKYNSLLPHASILLIQATTPDMTYRPIPAQLQNILPARAYILSFLSRHQFQQSQGRNQTPPSTSTRPILLHLLSSGGSNTSIILSWALSSPLSPSPISLSHYLRAIIHDSTPGAQDFWRAYNSLAVAFTSSPLPTRLIGKSLSFASMAVMHPLMKTEVLKGMEYLRRMLLETFDDKEAKRLYLVGRRDEVVNWEAVLGHAGEARAKGFEVKSVVFEKGEHCALPVENGDRYWGEVEGLWDVGSGGGEGDSGKLEKETLGADEGEKGFGKTTKSADDVFESRIRSKL